MSADTFYLAALRALAARLDHRAACALARHGCAGLDDIARLGPWERAALWADLNAAERWSDKQDKIAGAARALGLISKEAL